MNSSQIDENYKQTGKGPSPQPRLNQQQQDSQSYEDYEDNISSTVNGNELGVPEQSRVTSDVALNKLLYPARGQHDNLTFIPSSPGHDDHATGLSDNFAQLKIYEAPANTPSDMTTSRFSYSTKNSITGNPSEFSAYETDDRFSALSSQYGTYDQYSTAYDPYATAASNILGSGPTTNMPSYTNEAYDVYPYNLSNDGVENPVPSDDIRGPSKTTFDAKFDENDDLDPSASRPSLQRSGTADSVSLGTRRMKAVDLRAPPYTKEFIDQYRQRIKNDPDPEAHFQYAKYLIEAAKNIGSNASDQRSVRKYREILVQEALKVIRRLATQGDPYAEAQFFLANCHGTGMLGLQVDHERAYHLYLQAAKQNHAAAAYRVAVCNEIGAGTRREPPRAFAFYRKSASLGDTSAMYKLGMVLLSGGLGQPQNLREAVAWLRRAAEQADEDNPHALHELGLLYEQPDSQAVPHDPVYARHLFTKAAQLGYTQSQYKLGQCYEYGSLACSVDPRKSIAWYTKAAEKGDAEAELAVSGWYLTGSEGVLKQSDSEAYLWARRAANKGLNKAEYAVGYYAETGIGVKQDIELAKRWYMRAAAQGNKRAMNRLTELKRMGNKRGLAVRPTRQQAKDECVVV